jgi:hypothetical protein
MDRERGVLGEAVGTVADGARLCAHGPRRVVL